MPTDLGSLRAPPGHFVHAAEGAVPLIVRDSDGVPTHAVVGGILIPHHQFQADLEGYHRQAGLPAPDRTKTFAVRAFIAAPSVADLLTEAGHDADGLTAADMTDLVQTLDDASKYFLHLDGPKALVVENATGEPRYEIDGGKLVPIERDK